MCPIPVLPFSGNFGDTAIFNSIDVGNIRISDRAYIEAQSKNLLIKDIKKLALEGRASILWQIFSQNQPQGKTYPLFTIVRGLQSGFILHSVWSYNEENDWAVLLTINQIEIRNIFQRPRGSKVFPFNNCPVCNGVITEKTVEEMIKGGNDIAILHVKTVICMHCGERFYSPDTIKKFESVREKLENNQTTDFSHVGKTYFVN
jgi:YgiT-type zinc finger domain-containing protein